MHYKVSKVQSNTLEYLDYFFDVTSYLMRSARSLSSQLFSYIFKKGNLLFLNQLLL